jgi:tellurite resistance protein TerC
VTVWLWIGFIGFVLLALSIDLGVVNRKAHVIAMPEALAWTALWVTLALAFSAVVYQGYQHDWLGIASQSGLQLTGRSAALQFITGYIVEESLSVDNMVVIALVFSYFKVPMMYQHRVLFWGILGALVMRGAMIAAGTALLHFSWIMYVFGGLLLLTALKLFFSRDTQVDPEQNLLVRLARAFYPVANEYHGLRFFVRREGRRAMTLLFLVLLVVESSDVMFAVDSIPAVLGVTQDPFLVFTSNVFAILGLRSLYFALAGMVHKFRYLKSSLVVLLAFVGIKMILSHQYPISTGVSLAVIVAILAVGVITSLVVARRQPVVVTPFVGVPPETVLHVSFRQARRIAVLIIGSSVLLVGVAMIFLPGPAFVVIPAGLAVLSTEFIWARRILARIRKEAAAVVRAMGGKNDSKGEGH